MESSLCLENHTLSGSPDLVASPKAPPNLPQLEETGKRAAGQSRFGPPLKYKLLAGETLEEYKRRIHRVSNQKHKRKIYPNRRSFKSPLEPLDKAYIVNRIEIDPETGCWNWKLGLSDSGYAMTTLNHKHVRLHRKSYELWIGQIPNNRHVLHSCDNRKCVNPEHLFIGTDLDNMTDCLKKGRMPMGPDRPNAKLTAEQVIEIRRSSCSYAELSRLYGVSGSVVWNAKNGVTYKTV